MGVLVDAFNNATVEEQERWLERMQTPEPDLHALLKDALQRIRTLENIVLLMNQKNPPRLVP